jgi:hypothetical protein
MSKKILLGAGLSTIAIAAIAFVPFAGAQNSQGYQMGANGKGYGIETKAQIIGMTADELREQLQTKTMSEIVEGKGMTLEQVREQARASAMGRWQEKGFTEEEIQERINFQEEKQAGCDGAGSNQGIGGFRGGRR